MTDKRRSRTATVRASDNSMEVSIDRRLLLYALAAGATLACSVPSEAEIIFTPSSAVFQGPVRFSIDLDNDGSADFSFVLRQCRSFSGYQVVGCASAAGKHRFNEVAVNWQYQAAPLLAAATVGFRHRFRTSATMGTAFRYIGYWGQVKDRFLGVKFLMNGQTHFGWIGFRSLSGFSQFTATMAGWAYEAEPNKAIVAGDTGNGTPSDASVHPTSLEILAAGHSGIVDRRKRLDH